MMRPRRVIRQRPSPAANGEPAAQFVELAPGELSGVFNAPQWLRDLGVMSWLLVGIAALAVGVAVLLSLTNAIVAPVLTAAIVAAVLSPLVAKLQRGRLPRAGATAIVFLGVIAVGVGVAVLLLGIWSVIGATWVLIAWRRYTRRGATATSKTVAGTG